MGIVHFRWNPYKKDGDRRGHKHRCLETIAKLESFFNAKIEDIYPPEITDQLERNKELAHLLQNDVIQEKEIELEYLPFYQVPQIAYEEVDDLDTFEQKNIIYAVLQSLTPKERAVIEYRFGLNGKEELSLEDVGKVVGVTKERIRQIEAKALERLRDPSRYKEIKEYFD